MNHGFIVWACFAASEPGWLAVIDGTMNSELYQQIPNENIQTSVCALKRKSVMQQDNPLKHTSHSTKELVRKKRKNKPNGLKYSRKFLTRASEEAHQCPSVEAVLY